MTKTNSHSNNKFMNVNVVGNNNTIVIQHVVKDVKPQGESSYSRGGVGEIFKILTSTKSKTTLTKLIEIGLLLVNKQIYIDGLFKILQNVYSLVMNHSPPNA